MNAHNLVALSKTLNTVRGLKYNMQCKLNIKPKITRSALTLNFQGEMQNRKNKTWNKIAPPKF